MIVKQCHINVIKTSFVGNVNHNCINYIMPKLIRLYATTCTKDRKDSSGHEMTFGTTLLQIGKLFDIELNTNDLFNEKD